MLQCGKRRSGLAAAKPAGYGWREPEKARLMRIGFLLYDQLTQLDMTGPAQVDFTGTLP